MSKKSNFRRVVSAAIAALLCVSLFSALPAIADNENTDSAADTNSTLFVKQKTYSEYYDEIADMARPDKTVEMTYVGAENGANVEVGRYEGKDNVIVWSNEEGKLNFEVDVPQDGAYSIEMSYIQIEGGTSVSEVSVLLHLENSPFHAASLQPVHSAYI